MACSRRVFLQRSLGCAGYLIGGLSLAPLSVRRAFAAQTRGKVVAGKKFGRLEEITDGVWALISTPFRDGGPYTETVCNGGIVAGKDGILIVEAFYSEKGAAWLATQAKRLTGRVPTHLVVTHHHADHSHGLRGIERERDHDAPELKTYATEKIRTLIKDGPPGAGGRPLLPDATIPPNETVSIDLGGKVVALVPREGHTPSDVTVELEDPPVTWCGDLVWQGMFPNYSDAIPSRLHQESEKILARPDTVFVPGHGALGRGVHFASYRGLLREVEKAARAAFERGDPATEAARSFKLPESLGEWTLFNPDLFERAFKAWERELRRTR